MLVGVLAGLAVWGSTFTLTETISRSVELAYKAGMSTYLVGEVAHRVDDVTAALDQQPGERGAATEVASDMTRLEAAMHDLPAVLDENDLLLFRQLEPRRPASTALRPRVAGRSRKACGPCRVVPRRRGCGRLLEQVLDNLLRNAICYTGSSPIRRVRVTAVGQRHLVRFSVADTGPGVPSGERARVFEPFFRIEPRAGRGVGLGLATVRRIVESLGGATGVDDNPGGGAVFWFTLPVGGTSAPTDTRGSMRPA